MRWHNITSKTIHQMIKTDKDTTINDMSTGTIIDAKVMEEEVDSLGIATYAHTDQSSALYVTKKVTGMQTIHTRMGLISNSIPTVE